MRQSVREGPQAELVLQPLRLAVETKHVKLVELALDVLLFTDAALSPWPASHPRGRRRALQSPGAGRRRSSPRAGELLRRGVAARAAGSVGGRAPPWRGGRASLGAGSWRARGGRASAAPSSPTSAAPTPPVLLPRPRSWRGNLSRAPRTGSRCASPRNDELLQPRHARLLHLGEREGGVVSRDDGQPVSERRRRFFTNKPTHRR